MFSLPRPTPYYKLVDEHGKQITMGDMHDLEEPYASLPITSTDHQKVQAVLDEYEQMVGGTQHWKIIPDEHE